MYQVFCRSPRRGKRWVEYSAELSTLEEAESIKTWAESLHTLDLYENELIYKIKEVVGKNTRAIQYEI